MKETNPLPEWTGLLIHLWEEEHLSRYWTGKVPLSSSISISPVGAFLKTFFLMWTIFFYVFIEFVTILLLFIFCLFGPKAHGISVPWLGIELAPRALEGEVLTTGPRGMSLPAGALRGSFHLSQTFFTSWFTFSTHGSMQNHQMENKLGASCRESHSLGTSVRPGFWEQVPCYY